MMTVAGRQESQSGMQNLPLAAGDMVIGRVTILWMMTTTGSKIAGLPSPRFGIRSR
jgi:hypothetical protein